MLPQSRGGLDAVVGKLVVIIVAPKTGEETIEVQMVKGSKRQGAGKVIPNKRAMVDCLFLVGMLMSKAIVRGHAFAIMEKSKPTTFHPIVQKYIQKCRL